MGIKIKKVKKSGLCSNKLFTSKAEADTGALTIAVLLAKIINRM